MSPADTGGTQPSVGAAAAFLDPLKISNPGPIRVALAAKDAEARVIVHFRRPERLSAGQRLDTLARRTRVRGLIRASRERVIGKIASPDVRVRQRFDYIPAFAAAVSPSGLARLLAHAEIEHIEPDLTLQAHTGQGIAQMRAAAVRGVYSGAGVAVAICDTGIDYTHSRLGGGGFPNAKVIGGYDFGDGDANPMDLNGHGTNCAGIAAGGLPGSGNYIGGVAPDAKLYALKITPGSTGSAYLSDMIAAWQWCVTHQNDDPSHPIMVISTSFGGGGFSGTCDGASAAMTQAAASVVSAGMTLFASSGNDGFCSKIAWPACISNVISVGAVFDDDVGGWGFCVDSGSCAANKQAYVGCSTGTIAWVYSTSVDQVAPYSNVSGALDIFAPSFKAATTHVGGGFVNDFSGTSASCPYSAGIVAVMQSAAKTVTGSFLAPAQVKERLIGGGDPIAYPPAGITRPRPNLAATDIDGDGMPSGWEIDYFFDLVRDGSGDFDSDDLTDLAEYQAGTFPDDADSDDDEFTDFEEFNAGSDPRDEHSVPQPKGDFDANGVVELADAILGLQVLVGLNPTFAFDPRADPDGDGQIGMPDLVFILQVVSGRR